MVGTTSLIFLPAVFLSLLGLTMLASISPGKVLTQSIFLLLALFSGWIVGVCKTVNLLTFSKVFYLAALSLLSATLLLGIVTRGSTRWIKIGPFNLQTSEVVKPVLLLFSASVLGKGWSGDGKKQGRRLAGFWGWILPMLALVAKQPDLGTAAVLAALSFGMLYFSGLPWKLIIWGSILALGLIPAGKYFLKDYQVRRVETFINPYSDPRGAGYQMIQSTIAVGSGKIWGRGLGRGTQSQLKFLPERHTDFIFASLVEELGLAGGVLVVILYSLILFGLFRLIGAAGSAEERLVIAGTAVWLFFQAVVNTGMNLGLLPITGVTLPFLSAGGSSLVSSAVILSLAMSSGRRNTV